MFYDVELHPPKHLIAPLAFPASLYLFILNFAFFMRLTNVCSFLFPNGLFLSCMSWDCVSESFLVVCRGHV